MHHRLRDSPIKNLLISPPWQLVGEIQSVYLVLAAVPKAPPPVVAILIPKFRFQSQRVQRQQLWRRYNCSLARVLHEETLRRISGPAFRIEEASALVLSDVLSYPDSSIRCFRLKRSLFDEGGLWRAV